MKKWVRGCQYGVYRTEVLDEDNGQAISTVWTHKPGPEPWQVVPWPEGEANLSLVLAAPELLATLENVLEDYEVLARLTGMKPEDFELVRQARAAIAKAKGE